MASAMIVTTARPFPTRRSAIRMAMASAMAGATAAPAAAPAAPAAPSGNDLVARLGKLKTLLDAGLISQDDFDASQEIVANRIRNGLL